MSTTLNIPEASNTIEDLADGPDSQEAEFEVIGQASYSPDDNKLRLTPKSRLPTDLYERVKSAGFVWAPKQELFVAPKWTPEREDLLLELCLEIEDEDKSLIERAEEKADRLDDLSDKTRSASLSATSQAQGISERFSGGQPILVGHHSERKARKDHERMANNMRKAIDLWDKSKYWADRAAGAIRHAKYKERPDVRARRIKGLDKEYRDESKYFARCSELLKFWGKENLTLEQAIYLAKVSQIESPEDGVTYMTPLNEHLEKQTKTLEEAAELALRKYRVAASRSERWVKHYENRLTYERAMQAESGGTEADKNKPQVGGAIKCWASPRGGWSIITKVNKVSVTILRNWGNGGSDFSQTMAFDKITAIMSPEQLQAARAEGRMLHEDKLCCFVNTKKQSTDPTPSPTEDVAPESADETRLAEPTKTPEQKIEDLRSTLAAGIKIVVVPSLFPSPEPLAEEIVLEADIPATRHLILEPNAGTGRILEQLPRWVHNSGYVHAVEINAQLCDDLKLRFPNLHITCMDFLQYNPGFQFDRILMNPPFGHEQDIAHIRHAFGLLKPGGILVAICAAGPRQERDLRPLVAKFGGQWRPLPAGTFKEEGTNVNTILLTLPKDLASI